MSGHCLPKGWRLAELGEICREERTAISKTDQAYATMPYLGLEHIEPTSGRILIDERDARYSDSKSSNFRFTPKHVLYGKLRPYLNKVALPEFSGRCTTEIVPLMPTSVDRRWLAWLLRRQEVVDYAMREKTGSRMPRASMRHLMALSVAVPPRGRQRRIVAKLERQMATADRLRRATTAQLSCLSETGLALLRQTFPAPFDVPPTGWRWARLGDVCGIQKGTTAKRGWYSASGAWLVRYRDITASGSVRWEPGRNTFVEVSHEAKLQRLRPQTVLVGADAHDPATIGRKVALVRSVPRRISRAYFAGELLGIRADAGRVVRSEIVYHWLRSPSGYREIQEQVSGGHLNVKPAHNIRVPIPPPDDQRRIIADLARQLSALGRARTIAQAQLGAVDRFSMAALRQAFEP